MPAAWSLPVIDIGKLEGKESEEGGKNHWEIGDLHVAKFPFAHEAKFRKRAPARKIESKLLNPLLRFFSDFCDRQRSTTDSGVWHLY